MASIWKHPQSRFWVARFTDDQGIQRNRSTRETNKAKAQEIANGFDHASRLARKGLLSADKARAVVSEILERISGGQETIRSEPTDKFFARWLEQKAAMKSDATAARYKGTLERFMAHLGERQSRPLTAIRSADIQGFIARRAKERSRGTVDTDCKTLSAAFNYAVRNGLLDRNPCVNIELPTDQSGTRQVFTPVQVKVLLDTAKGDWRTAILIAYYAGARLSDAVNMEWANVDFTERVLRYRQRKTGTETTTPMHPTLQRHLESIAGDTAEPCLMPSLAGRCPGGKTGLSAQFNAIMREAGLSQERTTQKSGRSFASLSFHSLRHSWESHLAKADVSPEVRRQLVGRADAKTQQVYTHADLENLRAQVAKLPDVTTA